jgi:hypothetical protein
MAATLGFASGREGAVLNHCSWVCLTTSTGLLEFITSLTSGWRSSDQNLNLGVFTEIATLYISAYLITPL